MKACILVSLGFYITNRYYSYLSGNAGVLRVGCKDKTKVGQNSSDLM